MSLAISAISIPNCRAISICSGVWAFALDKEIKEVGKAKKAD